jgi:hypothetical protein
MKRVFSAAHYARRDRLRKIILGNINRPRNFNAAQSNQEANNDNFGIADMLSKTVVLLRASALDEALLVDSGVARH